MNYNVCREMLKSGLLELRRWPFILSSVHYFVS